MPAPHLWNGTPLTYQQMNENMTFINDSLGGSESAAGAAGASATLAAEGADAAAQSAADANSSAATAANILAQVLAHGNGWTPQFAVVADGERRVIQITDWSGGQGTIPAVGYVGPSGIVADISAATDIRGGGGAVNWSDISGAPATATRWPTMAEVTNKPGRGAVWAFEILSVEGRHLSGALVPASNLMYVLLNYESGWQILPTGTRPSGTWRLFGETSSTSNPGAGRVVALCQRIT